MPDPEQRIPRLTPEECDDAAREVFAIFAGPGWADSSKHHVITTFARHPALATPFLTYNKHLLSSSTLPVRLRQIAILRTAWRCGAVYMWSSHMRLSLDLGLSTADFEAAKLGAASPHWSHFERTIVDAADQLRDRHDLDDRLWADLSRQLDHKQILDLLFTVGTYAMLAGVFNAARIQREPELEALGDRLGVPGSVP